MAFVWNEELTTGIEKVDNRKEIFKQLNLLLDAMDRVKANKMGEVMAFLERLSQHFGEEIIWSSIPYEGFHTKAEHSQFIHDFIV